jgi:phosphomethylpyrimidine synthase
LALSCGVQEVEKLKWATIWGADTMMDLSTGLSTSDALRGISCTFPTFPWAPSPHLPVPRRRRNGIVENITWELFRQTLIEQAKQLCLHSLEERGKPSMAENSKNR